MITTPNLTLQRYLPAIFTILLVTFGTLFFFLKGENKTLSVKFFVIYSVATILIFGLIALETLFDFESPVNFYMGSMFVFGLIGAVHAYVIRNFMGLEENESFVPEFIFTLYIGFLGAAVFSFLFGYLNNHVHLRYSLIFATSIITLLIPFLFYRSFIYLVTIPAPVFKKWYYPVGEDVGISDEDLEDNHIRLLKFEVANKLSDPEKIVASKFKGPLRLEIGKMFAAWLEMWNDTDPGNTIDIEDEYSQPYGWNFYLKPNWFSGTRYLDPALTIAENDLKDGDIIIAERIID